MSASKMEKRDNPEAENSLSHCYTHICNFLVCRGVGSKGKGFFRVRVTSIKYICNKKYFVPHSSFGSSVQCIGGVLE